MKKIKIKSITRETEKANTYDITVNDVHHYILRSGIITHNTQDLFPKEVFSGGCLTAGHMVVTPEGLKPIESIVEGDLVCTLLGNEEVRGKETKRQKVYRITLENGETVECSADHRWLIGDWTEDSGWVTTTDLIEGQELTRIGNIDRVKNIDGVEQLLSI